MSWRWDDLDAQVICRQLGLHGGEARLLGHYGPGSGPIHLDTVQCVGTEEVLEDCAHRDWGNHDCSHAEDAGVRCGERGGVADRALSQYKDHLSQVWGFPC